MYCWEIVEGRDHPIPMGRPEFEITTNMKMVGIMIQLTIVMGSNGRAVIEDRGFRVLKGLLEIRKRGVYGITLIKKRRYWPMGVY